MIQLLKRAMLLVLFSVSLLSSSFADAKADISWTTTDVVLEVGKCTVKGYFYNKGHTGAAVTDIMFIVDVRTKKTDVNIWSDAWKYHPKDCYVPANSKKEWSFWREDEDCPRYTGKINWSVKSSVTHNI